MYGRRGTLEEIFRYPTRTRSRLLHPPFGVRRNSYEMENSDKVPAPRSNRERFAIVVMVFAGMAYGACGDDGAPGMDAGLPADAGAHVDAGVPPTWNNEIGEFMGDSCAGCHPWSNSYDGAVEKVLDGSLRFRAENGHRMTDAEAARLITWIDNGYPEK